MWFRKRRSLADVEAEERALVETDKEAAHRFAFDDALALALRDAERATTEGRRLASELTEARRVGSVAEAALNEALRVEREAVVRLIDVMRTELGRRGAIGSGR